MWFVHPLGYKHNIGGDGPCGLKHRKQPQEAASGLCSAVRAAGGFGPMHKVNPPGLLPNLGRAGRFSAV